MPARALVLIMSFSHAQDLDVLAACLMRQRVQADLPFVGLIGSQTKWASFRQRLVQRGFTAQELAHVTCPIGVPGITWQGARGDCCGRGGTSLADLQPRGGEPA